MPASFETQVEIFSSLCMYVWDNEHRAVFEDLTEYVPQKCVSVALGRAQWPRSKMAAFFVCLNFFVPRAWQCFAAHSSWWVSSVSLICSILLAGILNSEDDYVMDEIWISSILLILISVKTMTANTRRHRNSEKFLKKTPVTRSKTLRNHWESLRSWSHPKMAKMTVIVEVKSPLTHFCEHFDEHLMKLLQKRRTTCINIEKRCKPACKRWSNLGMCLNIGCIRYFFFVERVPFWPRQHCDDAGRVQEAKIEFTVCRHRKSTLTR